MATVNLLFKFGHLGSVLRFRFATRSPCRGLRQFNGCCKCSNDQLSTLGDGWTRSLSVPFGQIHTSAALNDSKTLPLKQVAKKPPIAKSVLIKQAKVGQKIENEKLKFEKKQHDTDVRIFDADDLVIGEMPLDAARELAKNKGLKLVQMTNKDRNKKEKSDFKLMTGQQLYEYQMKQKENKRKENDQTQLVKTVKMRHSSSEPDFSHKILKIKKSLEEGNSVEVVLSTNPKQKKKTNADAAKNVFLEKLTEEFEETCELTTSKSNDRYETIVLTLTPKVKNK